MRFMDNSKETLAAGAVLATEDRDIMYRVIGFAVLCLLPSAFLMSVVRSLLIFVLNNETYTHIPLIPAVSCYLIFTRRRLIFDRISYAWKIGCAMMLPGAACLALARIDIGGLSLTNQNSLLMFGFVLFWLGAFALFFGTHSFRAAIFPMLFLFFMVPVPQPLLSHVIYLLQAGSSKSAAWMFQIMGVPYLQQGFDFALPGLTIRVAEECSGIRSTLALLILTVLASHLFLKNSWDRVVLCLLAVPLSIAKNGFRIASLSTLAIYVNPSFLTGPLHHRGGIVFYVIALFPMFLLLRFLQKREGRRPEASLTH